MRTSTIVTGNSNTNHSVTAKENPDSSKENSDRNADFHSHPDRSARKHPDSHSNSYPDIYHPPDTDLDADKAKLQDKNALLYKKPDSHQNSDQGTSTYPDAKSHRYSHTDSQGNFLSAQTDSYSYKYQTSQADGNSDTDA